LSDDFHIGFGGLYYERLPQLRDPGNNYAWYYFPEHQHQEGKQKPVKLKSGISINDFSFYI
jgi:hypothetical protein